MCVYAYINTHTCTHLTCTRVKQNLPFERLIFEGSNNMYVPVHNMYIYTVDYTGLSLTKSQITESAVLEKEIYWIYWLQWNYSCCIKKRSPLYIHVCVSTYTDMIFYFATGYLCAVVVKQVL